VHDPAPRACGHFIQRQPQFQVLANGLGGGNDVSRSIATVAVVFLFCGVYSVAWTPLATCYPPEVLNYTCRASGMAIFSFCAWSSVVFVSFIFPFALAGIGWKFYLVNAAWDVVQVLLPIEATY
jgi:hypothetical protein